MRVDCDDDAPVVFKEINPVTYSALLFEEVAELTEEIFEASRKSARKQPHKVGGVKSSPRTAAGWDKERAQFCAG